MQLHSLPGTTLCYLLVTTVTIYGMLCLGFYFGQERFIFTPDRDPAGVSYDFGWPVEEIFLPVTDATLHTLWFRVDHPRGVVIYFHGNGGSLKQWGDRALTLAQRGYEVVMADYRGYGQSTGFISNEEQLFADARTVYNWARERYPERQIVLYGSSLGTAFASRLAAEYQPRLLVLESPFYSLEELAGWYMPLVPTMLLKYPLRSHDWIGQVRCPVIIFHGTDDVIIPYDHAERLATLVQAPLTFYRIEGGGHVDFAQYRVYQTALDSALGEQRQSLAERKSATVSPRIRASRALARP